MLGNIGLIAFAFVLAILMTLYVFQSYQVDGQSMETTLHNGDRLIVNKMPRTLARITKHNYTPNRGDIIIFNQSGATFGIVGSKQLIKRVVGLPGEHVVVKDGKITIYNSANPDGFNPDSNGSYKIASEVTIGNTDVTLNSHEIFVCGDNRDNSEDSRYFGPVDEKNIIGKMSIRVLPLNQDHRP